ncbi:MAG: recombinase family protein [Thermoanaerobacteraceae bacterium]|nr:recombinase family protein [Thermoanaerobacteraceae bacterium]
MDKKEIKTAYIYTRVSTEEQAQGFSLEAQADDIKKYCELHKIHIAGEYCDAGITGTSIDKRESFKQMLRDIKTHKDNIDAVIIWKLSRISRNMMDLVDIVRYFEEHNIVIISITDRIDTSGVMGKFFFYLVGAFAEMERENIVLQAKNGMKKRAEEGKWNGGSPPLGYDYYNDRELVVNEKEAKTVRLIFDLYSNKGWGYSRICQFLNRNLDQYATKNHKSWSYATVKQVLDNPTYAGYIRWGKQQNWSKERRKGTTKEYVLVKGKHEPIISEELWQRTQELRQGKKAPEKLKNMHYLLSGLAKCPQYGASMISQRTQRTRKSDGAKFWYRFYGCSQWANKKAICKPNLVKADLLEQQVLERIRTFARNPRLPELLAERLGKAEDIAELEKKLKSMEKKVAKLKNDEDKYYDFLIDPEKLKILKEEKIQEKIRQINSEMEQLTEEKKNFPPRLKTSGTIL